MEWQDEAIVLAVRPHGENAAIVSLLTVDHGRHAGLARGAFGQRAQGLYQPGNRVSVTWRARLDEHLGNITCELITSHSARLLDDGLKLAALSSACALADLALPERVPEPGTFDGLEELLTALDRPDWAVAYVLWELQLLADLGFGLDLSQCAATGVNDDLAYVSPKSGRAVSLSAGEPYRDRLLRLPAFVIGRGAAETGDIADGLALSGYFLDRHLLHPLGRPMPAVRQRLLDRLRPPATISGERTD